MMWNMLNVVLAQAAAPAAPATPGQTQQDPRAYPLQMLGLIVVSMFVLWFMTNRAQNKKAKEHAALMKSMKPGDKVLTSSGIMGVVVSVKDKSISLRSAESKLEVLKSAVTDILEREGDAAVSESKAS